MIMTTQVRLNPSHPIHKKETTLNTFASTLFTNHFMKKKPKIKNDLTEYIETKNHNAQFPLLKPRFGQRISPFFILQNTK